MFSKDTYIQRRQELKKLVGEGVILIFGNNNSPCNFPNNGYYPFRQDSTFLYYFGQQRDGLVGVIDIDNDIETLIGDDIDIEDIVWYGSVESVHDLAEQVGVHNSAPMKSLKTICNDAMSKKRKIHFLPPYRFDIKLQIFDLLGIHPNQQKEEAVNEAYKPVYLQILQEHEANIKAYNQYRQTLGVDDFASDNENMSIALSDVTGDGVPELLFVEKSPSSEEYVEYDALNIFTVENGAAKQIYYADHWETQVAGGNVYSLFQVDGESTLYSCNGMQDESTFEDYC